MINVNWIIDIYISFLNCGALEAEKLQHVLLKSDNKQFLPNQTHKTFEAISLGYCDESSHYSCVFHDGLDNQIVHTNIDGLHLEKAQNVLIMLKAIIMMNHSYCKRNFAI